MKKINISKNKEIIEDEYEKEDVKRETKNLQRKKNYKVIK